ncbi:MAG: GTP-binding protein [Lachnospiraceae bacterium]|nr:GTP-binding protein [Lachnospiraceae bacterium]
MKKIDLITGFLGSGKTTFIKLYAKYLVAKGEKVCILENDFGAVNVDMMLLKDMRSDNLELEMVAGGCDKDCHKRRFKTKLIAMGMEDYTRIIVEPSGIFDVDEFFDALYEEPLCNWYEIGNVIAIADGKIDKEMSESAKSMFASEIAQAGKVILSKVSLCSEEDILQTKTYIQDALNYVNCSRDLSEDYIIKDWSYLTEEDFDAICNASYRRESFIKRTYDENDSFTSLCFLEKNLTKGKVEGIVTGLFNNSEYGKVIRVKGFYKNNDCWEQINVTKNQVLIDKLPEGQDVIIVIGENLNETKISNLMDS